MVHTIILCCYYGFVVVATFGIGYLVYFVLSPPDNTWEQISMNQDVTYCFDDHEQFLNETTADYIHSTGDEDETNIVFVETSCKGGLDSRQACSIESAAKANPNWTIIVLFAGPIVASFRKSETFSTLSSLSNIRFLKLNITELTKETPHKETLEYVWKHSKYPTVHNAEMLRILWLYKHGGFFLDLDVLVLRSFDSLPKNFVIKQNTKFESVCILAMSNNGVGKQFMNVALQELRTCYNPENFIDNTPRLVTKVLSKICRNYSIGNMKNSACVHVLDSEIFEPISSSSWSTYYRKENDTEDIHTNLIQNDGKHYTCHMWNAFGGNTRVQKDSLYAKLAEKYCPNVFKLYKDEFGAFNFLY